MSENSSLVYKPSVYKPKIVQYNDGMETNIYGIAKQICAQAPQNPCTIQLMMDHEFSPGNTLDEIEFDLLNCLTTACLKILFGQDVNPFELSEQQMNKLKAYINSIGYTFNIKKEETATSHQLTMSFEHYKIPSKISKSSLDHLKKYMSK
jgi:hypothetical protein